MPSIQIGTLEAVLRRHGVPVHSFSAFLHFMDFMRRKTSAAASPFSTRDYYAISDWSFVTGMGDWVFAGPPYHDATPAEVGAYVQNLRLHAAPEVVDAVLCAREHAGEFLSEYAARILAVEPDIVGFTSTFAQNVPSLALARTLKTARPGIRIVFGGANCEGVMGEALIESFPWVDVVVRGEAEYALPQLIEALAANAPLDGIAGLCHRTRDGVRIQGFGGSVQVRTEDIPEPVYDEYFAALAASQSRKDIDPSVIVPVEGSRGCWWGEKHHCTFCGLNGVTMAFRSKPADRFMAEISSLSGKYARTRFHAADNIMDMRYFRTFVPALVRARESGSDFTFFYETKANLKKEHVELLAAAGVNEIQPGIESLSTRILGLIDKGVTALQNVQLLKWAREYGMSVEWNLIYGFPGERDEDWNEIHDVIPLLTHLQPPSLTPLLLERFSPYFDSPERYGMVKRGHKPWYDFLYPAQGERVSDMVYYFDYECADVAGESTLARVRARLDEMWNKKLFETSASTLTYRRGPGFVKISDRRLGFEPRDLILRGTGADVFLRLDTIATPKTLASELGRDEADIARICERLALLQLVVREGDRYLALPTAVRPIVARAPARAAAPAAGDRVAPVALSVVYEAAHRN